MSRYILKLIYNSITCRASGLPQVKLDDNPTVCFIETTAPFLCVGVSASKLGCSSCHADLSKCSDSGIISSRMGCATDFSPENLAASHDRSGVKI